MKRSRVLFESLDSFKIGEQIGEGGFASIYLASSEDGRYKYAMKKISKEKQQKENIDREVKAGQTLRHPNVAQFLAHFEDSNDDCLLFEYVKGKEFLGKKYEKLI